MGGQDKERSEANKVGFLTRKDGALGGGTGSGLTPAQFRGVCGGHE